MESRYLLEKRWIIIGKCYARTVICRLSRLPAPAIPAWAVRSAKTLSQMDQSYSVLSEIQAKILQVLQETGGAEPNVVAQRLRMKLPELERELATLRHMEKIRGKMRAGKKIVCLWEA